MNVTIDGIIFFSGDSYFLPGSRRRVRKVIIEKEYPPDKAIKPDYYAVFFYGNLVDELEVKLSASPQTMAQKTEAAGGINQKIEIYCKLTGRVKNLRDTLTLRALSFKFI